MDLLAALLGGIVGALVMWAKPLWWPAKDKTPLHPTSPTDVKFLIEDGKVIDECRAGKRLLDGDSDLPWSGLVELLATRFPDFPTTVENARARAPCRVASVADDDCSTVRIDIVGKRLRVVVDQPASADLGADHHLARIDQISLSMMTRAVGLAPFPVWITDETDQIIWHNPAYAHMGTLMTAQRQPFDHTELDKTCGQPRRIKLSRGADSEQWFEVSCTQVDNLTAYYAVDISNLVYAEVAQRGFVQTLTKTFANLGTGLAIFDKHNRLVLFNPALIDLTQMSAEFLSSRPSLTAFFDWLRDNRIMPEPRDYGEWRIKLRELTKEATEGTFSELWSLPNGLSYRVLGHPQTDGAVAFLFEDVTAELSLTRNFVKELEINTALLNRLPQAVAIFSPTGDILTVNDAYKKLWNSDPNGQIRLVDTPSAVAIWSSQCAPSDVWQDVTTTLNATSGKRAFCGQAQLLNGRDVTFSVEKLGKGASAVLFNLVPVKVAEKPAIPA